MKRLFLFLTLVANTAHGQIFADFSTTLGNFTVQLDEVNSPITVANFIILAEGSRPWIDSTTGALRTNTPFYNGIIFHRVIDDFIIQAGSPNRQGTDGPGYNFPDETANGLGFDTPYLLAMANSGPNSNGSQFFIAENTPTFLNGIHTIFGSVTVGRPVVDTIHATPVDADGITGTGDDTSPTTDVVINSVIIRRVGSAAQAFDEFAQELPIVSAVCPDISRDGTVLLLTQPSGSSLEVFRSTDLLTWTPATRFVDFTQSPLSSFTPAAAATPPAEEYFRASLVTLPPSATAPENYRGRTLTFTFGANSAIVTTNAGGIAGIGTFTFDGTETEITEFRQEFTNAYGASLLVFSENFVPFRFRLGADGPDSGRMTGTVFTATPQSIAGTYTLTTP